MYDRVLNMHAAAIAGPACRIGLWGRCNECGSPPSRLRSSLCTVKPVVLLC